MSENEKMRPGDYFKQCVEQLTAQQNQPQTGGTKFDGGKPPMELLPGDALQEVAKVLGFGAEKYAPNNWRKGFAWSRLVGAALRHLTSWNEGENKDPESKISHLAHAACMILFLLSHEIQKLGTDDRYNKGDK